MRKVLKINANESDNHPHFVEKNVILNKKSEQETQLFLNRINQNWLSLEKKNQSCCNKWFEN